MVSVVVAEKPSVARDLALSLGIHQKNKGYYEGQKYLITWAIGHLIRLKEPQELNPKWKKWDFDQLPIIPSRWELKIQNQTQEQFQVIKKLFRLARVKEIICATDAGREGELIFRYIFDKAAVKKPVKRLWISSLTKQAIKNGFASLREQKEFDCLAASAKGRNRADWLVGMNLSRAYSLSHDAVVAVGRVQTPTLSMLVSREKEIKNFRPEEYLEIKARFSTSAKFSSEESELSNKSYESWYLKKDYFKKAKKSQDEKTRQSWINFRRLKSTEMAEQILAHLRLGKAKITSLTETKHTQVPPQFYDLTELQRHANRVYGFTAAKTLEIAQSLYETKKCITYPRTDCKYISSEEAKLLSDLVKAIKGPYRLLMSETAGHTPLSKRFVDDSKITDHHAILPTLVTPQGLSENQHKIYDLICRRLLSAWSKNLILAKTEIITQVTGQDAKTKTPFQHFFMSRGTRTIQEGWRVWEEDLKLKRKLDSNVNFPKELKKDQEVFLVDSRICKGMTQAPPPMSESSLLTGMETAGRSLEEKELSDAMKGSGLGTPATRAGIIENLQRRGYIYRQGKSLRASEKGIQIIDTVAQEIKSPRMTGDWENSLEKIRLGKLNLSEFMDAIESHIKRIIEEIKINLQSATKKGPVYQEAKSMLKGFEVKTEKIPRSESSLDSQTPKRKNYSENTPSTSVKSGKNIAKVLKDHFGLKQFRDKQKEVCETIIAGKNSLLVMPTGAGKSLCYQLPGLVRGGCTIIISPLIALMDDQVSKLKKLGFAAESIHSGNDRDLSREICRNYLKGQVDFLFIAPERLGLRGFLELLAQKRPSLIAIDEAHCISQWGHDFRADYRKLGERLNLFKSVPKIALTATATLKVQDDIIKQLNIEPCSKFIAGFRRKNLEIEVIQISKPLRINALSQFLQNKNHLPAIVYALSRKDTEQIAKEISETLPAKPYHAGLDASTRQQIQRDFMDGRIKVVVATVAFGMGIDKDNIRSVIHMGLPASLAGYYQEIGRGGRDQKNAKVVLMYSYLDQKTHLFLHEKNYPPLKELKRVFNMIPKSGIRKQDLEKKTSFLLEDEMILEKLWIHRAVSLEHNQSFVPTNLSWEKSYLNQKELRLKELDNMWNFAESFNYCRMLQLIEYFGDKSDQNLSCGICDVCKPEIVFFKNSRRPTVREQKMLEHIWCACKDKSNWSKSALYQHLSKTVSIDKNTYGFLLDSLIQSGLIKGRLASFKKKGREISYYQVSNSQIAKNPYHISWKDINITDSNFH